MTQCYKHPIGEMVYPWVYHIKWDMDQNSSCLWIFISPFIHGIIGFGRQLSGWGSGCTACMFMIGGLDRVSTSTIQPSLSFKFLAGGSTTSIFFIRHDWDLLQLLPMDPIGGIASVESSQMMRRLVSKPARFLAVFQGGGFSKGGGRPGGRSQRHEAAIVGR